MTKTKKMIRKKEKKKADHSLFWIIVILVSPFIGLLLLYPSAENIMKLFLLWVIFESYRERMS